MRYLRHTDFYIPVLSVLSDDCKDHEVNQLIEETASYCGLSEEEKKVSTRGGTQLKYQSNIQWAITDLCQGGFIERTGRGIYRIVFEGLLMLEDNPANPDRNYLESRSEKFRDFRYRKGSRNKKSTEDEGLFSELSEEDIEVESPTVAQIEHVSIEKMTSEAERLLEIYHDIKSKLTSCKMSTKEVDERIRLVYEGMLRNSLYPYVNKFINQLQGKSMSRCALIIDMFNPSKLSAYIVHERQTVDYLCENGTMIECVEREVAKLEDNSPLPSTVSLLKESISRKPDNVHNIGTSKPKTAKESPKGLRVRFHDGSVIEDRYAADVFAKTIDKIGAGKVERIGLTSSGIPLVGRRAPEKYQYKKISGGFFIPVNSPTYKKKELLETIAEKLGITLHVELVKG